LRYSRSAANAGETIASGDRVDGAIAADGRVIAVWNTPLQNAASVDVTNRTIQARLFAANGQTVGGPFVVSEWENPANPATTNVSEVPRVAWRDNNIAMVWLSGNAPSVLADPLADTGSRVTAAKFFTVDVVPVLSITKSGANVTVSWTGTGVLQRSGSITGPWTDVGDTNPVTLSTSAGIQFFRVKTL